MFQKCKNFKNYIPIYTNVKHIFKLSKMHWLQVYIIEL